MKRYLLVFCFIYFNILGISNAQYIAFNRIYNSLGSDGCYQLVCGNGCIATLFLSHPQVRPFELFRFLPTSDTINLFRISTNSNPYIFDFKDSYYLIRGVERQQNGSSGTIQRVLISKGTLSLDSFLWVRPLTGQGINYLGERPMASFRNSAGNIIYISVRSRYPIPNTGSHPFIQEFDTSGNLNWEDDLMNIDNRYSGRGTACKFNDNALFISQIETKSGGGRGDTALAYGLWYDIPTRTIFKKKYLDYMVTMSSRNYAQVYPIKPGNKYLVSTRGRNYFGLTWPGANDIPVTYLTDSSLSIQNAYWLKINYPVTKATAMDDSNVVVENYDRPNFRIQIEKLNILTGDTIWKKTIGLPNQPITLLSGYNSSFDDSGNVYFLNAVFYEPVNNDDLWFAKLANVGQPWDPWATNPQGLSNKNKPLSLFAYPNPTSGKVKLRGYKEEEGLTLRIFSNSGKEVWRGIPSPEGEVDISNLSPGLFHIEALTSSGKRWYTRVVRE